MTSSELRRAMGAGVGFVVLFVAGVLLNNSPNIDSTDTDAVAAAKFVTYVSDSGNRARLVVGAFLLVFAALALVWFTLGLRAWIGIQSAAGRLVSHLGVLGAGAIAAGAMASAAVAGPVTFGSEPVPRDGDTIRIAMDLAFPFLFVVFGLTSAALIAAVVIGAIRAATAPKWVVYTGWVAVLGSLGGVVFVPFVLPLLWYLAIAVLGLTRAAPVATHVTDGHHDHGPL